MQVQVDEVRKENVIIKCSNIQLAGNLEDAETRLVEIQLNLESSHANDSSVAQGGETEMLKLKIEAMEVELEELKNINEFNDEILQHKEDDIDKLHTKSEAGSASTGSGERRIGFGGLVNCSDTLS
jgi:chromosome segregation ATPase